MNQADLESALQAMLNDAADKFDAADITRLITMAGRELGRLVPLVKRDTLTLVAEQAEYTAPADLLKPISPLWGVQERQTTTPWDDCWPGRLPRLTLEAGSLLLTPAPTAAQINLLGSEYAYRYAAAYTIAALDADTTVPDRLEDALLVRACAQAMQELAYRGIAKPVALGGSGNGLAMPRNGHPAALANDLLYLFEHMAA